MPTLPTEPLQITEPGAPSERRRGRNDLRRNLVGLSRSDLKTTLTEAGLEPFRAQQVWHWIYWHGVTDFGRMSNIAKKTRDRLAALRQDVPPPPALEDAVRRAIRPGVPRRRWLEWSTAAAATALMANRTTEVSSTTSMFVVRMSTGRWNRPDVWRRSTKSVSAVREWARPSICTVVPVCFSSSSQSPSGTLRLTSRPPMNFFSFTVHVSATRAARWRRRAGKSCGNPPQKTRPRSARVLT